MARLIDAEALRDKLKDKIEWLNYCARCAAEEHPEWDCQCTGAIDVIEETVEELREAPTMFEWKKEDESLPKPFQRVLVKTVNNLSGDKDLFIGYVDGTEEERYTWWDINDVPFDEVGREVTEWASLKNLL